MSTLEFNKNERMGLGVEIEIQLVDANSGDLTPVGPRVLSAIRHAVGEPLLRIKSELFQSMLEIDTPICANAFEVSRSLRESLATVRNVAFDAGANVLMAGTHPFAHYAERQLTIDGRYFSLVDRNQWITRRLQIFGLHIHLGMRDGDHAIAMNNALCHYLPIILALSASSPFWHGEDTGLASSRITFFEATPTGGHPYLLNSWNEFERLVHLLVKSRSIMTIKDLWWDIRPNVEFGTIEVRIADCPPTLREVEALVALIHTIAKYIDFEMARGQTFAPPPEWILRENKWRASRHGVQCDLISDLDGTSLPFKEIWQKIRGEMQFIWSPLQYDLFIKFIDQIVDHGPSYIRQRANAKFGMDGIVRHLVRENEADLPEWGINI